MLNKDIKAEFYKFWSINFPYLPISAAWFYNWPHSLRFDLQTESSDDESYFSEVLNRASTLFEFVFHPTDEIYLIYQEGKMKRSKIRRGNDCFKQIENLENYEIAFQKVGGLYEHFPENFNWNRAILKVKTESINFKQILNAIANLDFPSRKPRIQGEVYFISGKGIGFNMYDDRGLDIIAIDSEVLWPMYEKFNAWILDYDREAIDKKFTNII